MYPARLLTAEDVQTARALVEHHLPVDDTPGAICASAAHRTINAQWPCQQARWAHRVLDAHARGQIPGELL